MTAIPEQTAASATRERVGRRHRGAPVPMTYFAPVFVVVATVYLYPLIYLAWLTTRETVYFQPTEFVGLTNIRALLFDDRLLLNLRNTLRFAVGALALALPAGLGAAMFLQRITHARRTSRTLLLLPWLMSQATVGTIWLWFLNPRFGPAAYAAREAGLGQLIVFSSPRLAPVVLVVMAAWWSYPQAMLFFMGSLQSIPAELMESVKVDGGGAWAGFRYVTLPHVRNTAITVSVVLLMLYLHLVTLILVTTGGGPLVTTETVSMRIYNQLFTDFDLGGAAASSMLLFVVNIVLTVLAIRLRRREEIA